MLALGGVVVSYEQGTPVVQGRWQHLGQNANRCQASKVDTLCKVDAFVPRAQDANLRIPLSCELGICKTVKASLCPWLLDKILLTFQVLPLLSEVLKTFKVFLLRSDADGGG